jgi:hypothetical protein
MNEKNETNISETTLNGIRAVVEVRWEDTRDGEVAELTYLVLFNERAKPLRVIAGDTGGSVGPGGGFTEILIGYRTEKTSWSLSSVDTDIGQVTWDTDEFPPKVRINPDIILD